MTSNFLALNGIFYQDFLANFHKVLLPETCFEIGTLNGETLRLTQCASICVDPTFRLNVDFIGQKPACHLFQMSSDAFFRRHSPTAIFGQPIQMAFLDGLHLFEFFLRDFANTEKHCAKNSVIILHDCLPGDEHICLRSPADPRRQQSAHPHFWTGDVWKVIPALKAWRNDLRIIVTDAQPTGLVLISNLDPKNTVIDDNYAKIVDDFISIDLGACGVQQLHDESNVIPTSRLLAMEDIARYFWL